MPRWPRRMSSWCESGTWRVPIEPTSRPDENDLPSPRQITARTSCGSRSSPRMLEELRVHVVVERVVLLGLSLVIVATSPSISSRTVPGIART